MMASLAQPILGGVVTFGPATSMEETQSSAITGFHRFISWQWDKFMCEDSPGVDCHIFVFNG